MVKLAKRIKAVVCASILVASTAIASLVPATPVKAEAPAGCSISIVSQEEYNAGETVKIKTSFTDATKITYEFYSQSFNPYYGYVPSTKKFSVEKDILAEGITTGNDVVINIPSNARGTYTVKAVFENANGDKTTVTAATKLSVKNSSYDKSMAYYYYLNGNSGSTTSSTVPSWYYYYLLNDDEDDNNALLYYYYMNNSNISSTDPMWYYLFR